MRKIALAAIALAVSGTAYAADMPVKALLVAPISASWTGWYVGINGGGVWGTADTSVSFSPGGGNNYAPISGGSAIVVATGSNRINNSGGLVGGQFGYLWQNGRFVGGLEAAFDWMNARGSSVNTAGYTQGGSIGQTFTFSDRVSTNWLFTFLARAGFDMGGWYPYVTGGLAVADLKFNGTFVDSFFDPGKGLVSINQARAGFAVGGGAEWRFNSHWSMRGEYLYMVFDGISGTLPVAQSLFPGNIANLNHSVKFTENIARAALSYHW
jgi:outer membrane immunogenic protein